jgi:proline iminopeptidase
MSRWPSVLCPAVLVLMAGCAAQPEDTVAEKGLENGSFFANLNGFQIHYEVHGSGPVVMTVPNSWGLSLAGLRGLYRGLEDRLTIVYFDPRGMGQSDPIREESDMGMAAVRADFDALRRHLGLETVHAIGWSNGAANLIFLAAEYPDTISSAIFLHGVASFTEQDMAAWAEKNPDLVKGYERFQQEMADQSVPVEEKTARQKEMWLSEFFPRSCADPDSTGTRIREVFAPAEFSWPHADYSYRELPVFDARDELSRIRSRSLVIVGAHDMSPPEKGRELHEGIADSEYVLFENSGHFAPLEEPEAFRAAVLKFLGVV